MNWLLIIIVILCLWRACRGWVNGFAGEVIKLISLVTALFVLALVLNAISNYMQQDTSDVVISVIVIVATGIVFRLLSILLNSLKTLAELPVIAFLNRLMGIAVGIFEVIVGAWIMYAVILYFPTGEFGIRIMRWTMDNPWLTRLYQADIITEWVIRL